MDYIVCKHCLSDNLSDLDDSNVLKGLAFYCHECEFTVPYKWIKQSPYEVQS
mgnify:CR=1 FL=1|jgi:hypothetical protein